MIMTIVLCIMNVNIHFIETRDAHKADGIYEDNFGIWKLTLTQYWGSILIALYAILFGVFVFALCAFHTLIISQNLTTYEKLKKQYARFPQSPFAFPSCTTNWTKFICCPRRSKTKLSYMLFLRTRDEDKFAKMKEERERAEQKPIPTDMMEDSA